MANRITTWSAGNTLTAAALNGEFNNVYTGTLSRTSGSFGHNDDIPEYFGSSSDAQLEWDTGQTQDALMLGLSGSNTFIVCEKADMGTDFAIAAATDPLFVVHSADATTAADYIALSHNQTNGVVTVGAGVLTVAHSATTVTFPAETGTLIVKDSTLTATGNHMSFTCTDAGAVGGLLEFYHNSANPADDDVLFQMNFYGKDDGAAKTLYGAIRVLAEDVTNATEDGRVEIRAIRGGAYATVAEFGASNNPTGYDFQILTSAGDQAFGVVASSSTSWANLYARDLGNDSAGPQVLIGHNSNATNPNPGCAVFNDSAGTAYYVYVSTDGKLRIHSAPPAGAVADTAGTIVGTQAA